MDQMDVTTEASTSKDKQPQPRNQPKSWNRNPRSTDRRRPPFRKPTSSSGRENSTSNRMTTTTIAQAQTMSQPSSVERVRPLRSFEPILINTSFLRTLAHLVSETIFVTDPRLQLTEYHLFYTASIATFERLMRCDAMLGFTYTDYYQVSMLVSNMVFPMPIADYIEAIGPFRLMNGINIIPSVASFLGIASNSWLQGNLAVLPDTGYLRESIIHPSMLTEQRVLDEYHVVLPAGMRSTVWDIDPTVLSFYRMCADRLSRKTPCRPVSNILAGSPLLTTSTRCLGAMTHEVLCCESQPVCDVKKACILNYNLADRIREWPRSSRNMLRPLFTAGNFDEASTLATYSAVARQD